MSSSACAHSAEMRIGEIDGHPVYPWARCSHCQYPDRILAMAAPGPWIHRVAVNLANSHFRRMSAGRRAHQRLRLERPPDRTPDPTDGVAVRQALQALPLRQRSAIVLRYYADLSIRDI